MGLLPDYPRLYLTRHGITPRLSSPLSNQTWDYSPIILRFVQPDMGLLPDYPRLCLTRHMGLLPDYPPLSGMLLSNLQGGGGI